MMKLVLAAALIGLATLPAPAALAQPPAGADVKINQLIIYGDETCPPSTDDQINICAKKTEEERYRIPSNLRGNPNDPKGRSWADRAMELQYVGRSGIGSCSPSGAGGFTGCLNQLISNYRTERAGRDSVNWNAMIEEARKERLSRIDAEAKEADEAENPR